MRFVDLRQSHHGTDVLGADLRDSRKRSPLAVNQSEPMGHFLQNKKVWSNWVLVNAKSSSLKTVETILHTLGFTIITEDPMRTGSRSCCAEERIADWRDQPGFISVKTLFLMGSRPQTHARIRSLDCHSLHGSPHGFTMLYEDKTNRDLRFRTTIQPQPQQHTTRRPYHE